MDRADDNRSLPLAHRRSRPARPGAAFPAGHQSRRARDRRSPRCRAPGRTHAGAAARHSDRRQGQHRHGGSHDDHRRVARARRLVSGAGCDGRAEAARRGCDPAREGQSQRMGEFPFGQGVERLERARRPVPQSVCARPQPGGLECRLRCSHLGEPCRGRHRHRDRRLDRFPLEQQRARRHQAHGRPRQSGRDHSDFAHAGHRRPDGAHGGRGGDPAGRHRRTRPARPRDAGRHRQGPSRLHAVPRSRGPRGSADRRGPPVLRVQPRRRRTDGRGARGDEGTGSGARRSGEAHARPRLRRRRAHGPALRVQGRARCLSPHRSWTERG